MSIFQRLLAALLLLALTPMGGLIFFAHQAWEESLVATIAAQVGEIADKKRDQIESYIAERRQDAMMLSRVPRLAEDLVRLRQGDGTVGQESMLPYYQREAARGGYYDLFLVSAQGDVLLSVKREADLNTNLRTGPYRHTELARVVETALTTLEADFSQYRAYEPSRALAAFVAAPLLSSGQTVVGAVALQLDERRFQEVLLDNTGLGVSGEIVITRQEGEMVRFLLPLKHPTPGLIPSQGEQGAMSLSRPEAEAFRRSLQGERGSGFVPDYRGVTTLAAWRYLPAARLGMVVKRDADDALSELHRLRRWELILALGVLVSVVLTALYLGRSLLRPIRGLTRVTAALAAGDLTRRAEVAGRDEIAQLAASFNTMAQALQESRELLEQRVGERTRQLEMVNVHLLQEIGERQRVSEELRRTLELQQAILDSANYTIIATDAAGVIRLFNQAAERLLGYDADDVVGRETPGIIHDPEEVAQRARELSRELGREILPGFEVFVAKARPGMPDEQEWTYVRQDGGRFPVRLSVTPILDDQGSVTGFLGVGFDITAHRQAEASLLLARKAIENASEAIVITDTTGTIVEINPAYERITGYDRAEVVGKNPKLLKSGRHDSAFYESMWRDLTTLGCWEGEVWDRRKNGEVFPKWLTINAIKDREGETRHYVGIFLDISKQKATEEKLEKLAFYDPLTDLPNRILFRDRISHELEMARRLERKSAVFFIDLDRFKYVNDSLGHEAGDALLVDVGQRLVAAVRTTDTVCRLGGDEFAIILPGIGLPQVLAHMAGKLIQRLQQVYFLKGAEVFISASVGIAVFPDDGQDLDTLSKNADLAMYKAKEAGRGTYRFFTPIMNQESERRLTLEGELRRAIERQHLTLHYQPKIHLASGVVTGMEALVRWQHPDRGMISPAHFIPIAEETGLIVPLGQWVLREACRQLCAWREQGLPRLRVAVNLSARQFQDPTLLAWVSNALAETGVTPAELELEITESVVMGDADRAIAIVQELRGMGLFISIDDFGTGYSSLSYLKKFPLHALKVDQSFVRELPGNSDDAAIVTSIISMAHAMGLKVIAEGVETGEQAAFLRERHCQEVQGYFFSRPLAAEAFAAFVRQNQAAHRDSGG